MFAGFGPTELIIVLVIVLLIFGPKRLPGLGRQIGTGMREFKDSITGRDEEHGEDHEPDRRQVDAALGRPAGEAEPAPPVEPAREPLHERTPQP